MRLIKTPMELREALKGATQVGLVPTMGYLHRGHLSLVERCRLENSVSVISIFVNPTQFGPNEDLAQYPRDLNRDLELLGPTGVDLVFAPDAQHMYPHGFSTWVEETRLSTGLCGASRPGHFKGVCTVVLKLFNLVNPNRAYFGEKDYQQLKVIQRMVRDLDLRLEVVGCPIVREDDGLAMSSRNVYLRGEERELALCLWRALSRAQEVVQRGETSAESILSSAMSAIPDDPRVKVDYVKLVHPETLEDLDRVDHEGRLLMAVKVGSTRLIDNGPIRVGR